MKKLTHFMLTSLLTVVLCAAGTVNAWGATYSSGSTTVTVSGTTITVSGDGSMADYANSSAINSLWGTAVSSATTLVVEEGVTHIGAYSFYGFNRITSVTIPSTVTSIGQNAFNSCTAVAEVHATTPNDWASIDFQGSTPKYAHPIGSSSASNRNFYFYGKASAATELLFTPEITEIKKYAFYNATGIENIYIPGTITALGNYAFYCSVKRAYVNKSVAPTPGTSAITWLSSGTYLYLRADATNSYNKTPWYNTTSNTTTGAKTLGYNDYSNTRISCPWKSTRYLHIVSGSIDNIEWTLDEDGTLTLIGHGDITKTFNTTNNNANVIPWFRLKQLVHKVVIKGDNDGDITDISNALAFCDAIDEIIIEQTTIPNADAISTSNSYKKSTDKINVFVDNSSIGDPNLSSSPWNNSAFNISYTYTFCSNPTGLTASSIGGTSASFAWTDNSGDTWKYICKLSSESEPTSSEWASASSTNSKSVTISGLTPASDYTFYLISDCGTIQSSVLSADFTTECDAITTIPWSYGFEDATSGQTPTCWAQVLSNASGWFRAISGTSYRHTGSKAARLYGGTSTSKNIAVFPEFEDDINDLEVSFWYKAKESYYDEYYEETITYGNPIFGYITNVDNINSFQAVHTLDQSNDYILAEGLTVSGAPAGARFAIQYKDGTTMEYLHIDDITVSEKPACAKPTSVAVTADSETAEGATITWSANGMSAWKMQVSEGDAASWGEETAVATNSKVLTGLKANTLYFVRVKADCGGGSVSEWSDNVSFTTLCGVINVNASTPWNIDFQALSDHIVPDCWDNSASTTSSSWDEGYIWGTYSNVGNCMLRMDNSILVGGTAIINTPEIVIPADGKEYELNFDLSNKAIAGNNLIVKISANGGAFAQKGIYYSEGASALTPGDFHKEVISLADYSGQTIKVQFYAEPTGGTSPSDGAIFVDNVSVHKVSTCFPPTALAAGNLSANSARISWTAGGSESAWRVQYRPVGGDWSAEQVANTASYNITGLTTSSDYVVRVKAYCDADDQSGWSEELAFTTLCAATSMPLVEHFSSASELPSCWDATPASGTYRWKAGNDGANYFAHLQTNSVGKGELRLPPITLSSNAILRFEWKNANGIGVNLYVSSDGGSTKTLLPNDLSSVHADWTTKIFDLSAFTGETVLIYFVANFSTMNQNAYLDDVEVVERPCNLITNIQAAPVTGGANISWSGNVKKLQYKTGSDAWSSVSIPSGDYAGPKTIIGLTSGRTYQVRLLPACSEEEESNWTTPINFVTSAIESVPYYNNFESETPGSVPFNWSRVSATEYPQISYDAYAYREPGVSQGHSIKFFGGNDQIIVLPEFDADLADLAISFHYRNSKCKMELGYVAADGVTFTAIETLTTQGSYGVYPYEKDLFGFSGNAYKLAIRYSEATDASAQAYVDNVMVKTPTCGQPAELTHDNLTANSIHISWAASIRDIEPNYQYILRTWVLEDDIEPNWASATTISSSIHELNFNNLSSNTAYEFYLRSSCGASEQSIPLYLYFETLVGDEVFDDNASAINNESRLYELKESKKTYNVIINRQLPLNGDYSTICLPFDLSFSQLAQADCPLHGFVIKEFDHSDKNDDVVDLFLRQVTSIEAGKPYFVRFAGAASDNRLSPLTFNNVKIKCSTPVEVESAGGVQPYGIFNPHALTGGDHTTYFLSSNNTLYWPSANGTLNGFRVYVHIDPSTPLGNALYHGAPMRIRESSNSATGVDQVDGGQVPNTRKVLREGQIIIIRDGKEYNAQGMRIQ